MENIINRAEIYTVFKSGKNVHRTIVRAVEKVMIEEALIFHRGNQTKVAEACSLSRGTLRKRMAEFGLLGKVA